MAKTHVIETHVYAKKNDGEVLGLMVINIIYTPMDKIYYITIDNQGHMRANRYLEQDAINIIHDYVAAGYVHESIVNKEV